MATDFEAEAAKAHRPANSCNYGALVSQNSGKYEIAAALVINDTIALCKLPAQEVPVDLVLNCDDLDSDGTPAIVLDVGIYDPETGNPTSDPDCFIDASDVAQAGGIARMNVVAGRELAPVNYDRSVRATVVTAPATGATSGGISATLLSRPMGRDD